MEGQQLLDLLLGLFGKPLRTDIEEAFRGFALVWMGGELSLAVSQGASRGGKAIGKKREARQEKEGESAMRKHARSV